MCPLAVWWGLRSPNYNNNNNFVIVWTDGNNNNNSHAPNKKSFLFCCYIFDCPFQKFVFFVDQFTQVLGHLIQLFHCIL